MLSLRTLAAAVATAFMAFPAFADTIEIKDAYARSGSPMAKSGAAFMQIHNTAAADDRLIKAETDSAMRVELHTHIIEDGVARMREVEGGFVIPAGGTHSLERGADHVMMMGLTTGFVHGEEVTLTLIFENAGEITLTIPIDLERMP